MTDISRSVSKADAAKVLRRIGTPEALGDEILGQLPDPIDLDNAEPILVAYGMTLDAYLVHLA